MTLRQTLTAAAVLLLATAAPAGAESGPDVVITRIDAPTQVLSGWRFSVGLTLAERSGTAGGTVTATVSSGGAPLGSATVSVDPGGTASVAVPLVLVGPGWTGLDVQAGAATGSASVEVTSFQVVPWGWTGPPLAGHGGQFNQNVYASISRADGVDDANVAALERSVRALRPQFSRIFFNPAALRDSDLMQSFVRTVLLAQESGATIDVTWQSGALDVKSGTAQKFADVLVDLVRNRHVTGLRWVTIQNEPNSTKMTPAQYEAAYRALDRYIASIRGQVGYMGGDLVATNQRAWFTYMATHMADLLDAYSIHVFWDYWDTEKLEQRLTEVRQIVDALPEAGRKPVYVAEYGVRGVSVLDGVRTTDPGAWADGTPIAESTGAAFQHAWFDVLAARLGFAGTSKWDLYFGRYDKGTQAYWIVGGPRTGWPRHPLYNLLYLLTHAVGPGWHAVELEGGADGRLLTAYAGSAGEWTVIGLDRAGGQLNGVTSQTAVEYSIGGLPPATTFRLVLWNAVGDGLDGVAGAVTTDSYGVVAFTVPQHAVFALTNVGGRLEPRPTVPSD